MRIPLELICFHQQRVFSTFRVELVQGFLQDISRQIPPVKLSGTWESTKKHPNISTLPIFFEHHSWFIHVGICHHSCTIPYVIFSARTAVQLGRIRCTHWLNGGFWFHFATPTWPHLTPKTLEGDTTIWSNMGSGESPIYRWTRIHDFYRFYGVSYLAMAHSQRVPVETSVSWYIGCVSWPALPWRSVMIRAWNLDFFHHFPHENCFLEGIWYMHWYTSFKSETWMHSRWRHVVFLSPGCILLDIFLPGWLSLAVRSLAVPKRWTSVSTSCVAWPKSTTFTWWFPGRFL